MSMRAVGPFPSLFIEHLSDGKGINFDVINDGEAIATNVTVTVEIIDGFMIRDRSYQEFFSSVSVDETISLHMNVWGIGLGWYDQVPTIQISVETDNINTINAEQKAHIFGPYVTFVQG